MGEALDVCMQVGFETEGTAIYDTMRFVKNEVSMPSFTYAGNCVRSAVPSTGSIMHGHVLLGSDVAINSWMWHCFQCSAFIHYTSTSRMPVRADHVHSHTHD